MLDKYKYILVQFYDDDNHICQLYQTIEGIAKELGVHRTTISKLLKNNSAEYIKNHNKYYILKLN